MPGRPPLLLAILLAATPTFARADASKSELPNLPTTTWRLGNGLTVLLSEDHTVPLVTVYVTYRVGSKDERPGRTGFAHLFEHVMFQGSKHVADDEHIRLVESVGGDVNGNTTQDRTVYFETVPSNYLERVLWLESDRMGFLLDTLDQSKLDQQRGVVQNERRQSYENRPYGLAYEKQLALLWPPGHPYGWPTIGSMADLDAATLADVSEFFRHWYVPSNAALTIVGDVHPAEARAWVEKYFGGLPSPPTPSHPAPAEPPPLAEDQRVSYEDNVQLPRLYLAWRAPPFLSDGDIRLDVASSVLGGGRSSRLYRRLVFGELATDVSVAESSGQLASTFEIVATARPGHTLGELEKVVNEELEKLAKEPPTAAEVATAQTELEAATTFGVETTLGRAARFAQYWQAVDDPDYLAKDVARHRAVTPVQASEALAKYVTGAHRVAVAVVPGPKPAARAAPPQAPGPVAVPPPPPAGAKAVPPPAPPPPAKKQP